MSHERTLKSSFLMLVLVLGFVSYSSIPSIGVVFADEEDCDDLKGKEKADCKREQKQDEKEKSNSKDNSANANTRDNDEDDDDDDDDRGNSNSQSDRAANSNNRADDDDEDDDDRRDSNSQNQNALQASNRDDDDDDDDDEDVRRDDRDDDDDDMASARDDDEDDDDDDDLEGEDEDDDRKVTICHFPPGNPANAHTITVGKNAAEKHIIRHGDTRGQCPNEGPGEGDISIHGIKYFDANQNGMRDSGEQVIDGWEIVLLLSSKTVDTEFTNGDGEYWFDGLKEGTYEVREVIPPGWEAIEPFGGTYEVILSSDSKKRAGFDFGNFRETSESDALFQELLPNRASSIERSDDIVSQLMQKIEQLETRLQNLLEKLESGNYYGNISNLDPTTRSFGISFDGSATSDDTTQDVSGEIFLESLVTDKNTSKFRITGGKITVGDTTHDIVFGKARASSTGPSDQKDSMVLIAQLFDDQGNENTVKLVLDFEKPLVGNFGVEPMIFEITPQSGISKDWSISATGQLTVM